MVKPALLRLEDVGPGGPYASAEDLGKLRAVFAWLREEQVPFHVALIPRWKNLLPDGTWYEKGIDAGRPDTYLRQFIGLMVDAQRRGALFGMHGYTHQYGNQKLPGNDQDSAVGSEFNVEGQPESQTVAYAEERILKSLAAFRKAGLYPEFWESPHYNDTPEQEEVFGKYVRVLYQPDAAGRAEDNMYIADSGTVYVPTPLDYIHEQNTVAQVLERLKTFQGLASIFFHPILEFDDLEKVLGTDGTPVMMQGLPLYRYPPGKESNLQRLVRGFRQKGFAWACLYEVVPAAIPEVFPPAIPKGGRHS